MFRRVHLNLQDHLQYAKHMATVAKWLRHLLVAQRTVGSTPTIRPVIGKERKQ